ncbi:MAG: hypothetical protein OEZ48_02175 [Candidatus Bathyarchaeota archaeon]|nr:hypothetical protein [Candidatus Bathyarchaeota archaeon]MDH5686660.1 hypothetical protein [Candidatus Bathyarchaeota archaeon]
MTRELWTELIFSYFPVDRENIRQQILARVVFLFAIWTLGLVAYSLDGLLMLYASSLEIVQTLFGTGFIVLLGSYMVQRALPDVTASFRPLVRLDDESFMKLSERVQRHSRSFLPILVLSLVLTFWAGVHHEILKILTVGVSLHSVYFVFLMFLVYLLIGTGIWLGVSIWITIFLVSRQPLDVELSTNTVEKFRGLSRLALWFSLFYFIALSIGGGFSMIGSPALTFLDIIISPFFLFIIIGIISILFPFYNIHLTLLRLKKQQLSEIEEQFQIVKKRLDTVVEDKTYESNEGTMKIVARLLSLQIKERGLRSAPEWPVDTGFFSKLLTLVLIPAVVRVATEILNRTYFV